VIHGQLDRKSADKDYIPIPADSIRTAYGLKPQKSGNQLGALPFLWAYKCFVDPELEWSKYTKGRCRRITNHGTPQEIMDEATKFFHDRKGKTVASFMKGNVTRQTRQKLRTAAFDKMDEKRRTPDEAEIKPPEITRRMIEYHNGLTRSAKSSSGRSIYGELANDVDDAVEVLLKKADAGSEVYNKGVRQSIRQLRRFQDMPYMLYQSGNYTPRPTPVGGNHLVGVDKHAIPPLLGDRHVALDLSKAQLAMFAAVAEDRFNQDMSNTKAALNEHLSSSRFDLWESLTESIAFPCSGVSKEVSKNGVKRGTYSTVFCAATNTVKHNISKEIAERSSHHYPEREMVEGFTDHEVIKEVLEARENARRQLSEKVEDDRCTRDAFGRTLDLNSFCDGDEEDFRVEQPQLKESETDSEVPDATRSMLAYIIQSFEVRTMWPIFKAAIKEHQGIGDDEWRILLYKYDEVILWSRRPGKTREWAEKAINLVDEERSELGVKTRLDVEYAPWK
jgi:hypothetical protein